MVLEFFVCEYLKTCWREARLFLVTAGKLVSKVFARACRELEQLEGGERSDNPVDEGRKMVLTKCP